jgi:hypothetical protein
VAVYRSVFVFESPRTVRPYKSLQLWGDNAGPGYVFEDGARMFMPRDFHQKVFKALQLPICQVDDCK